MFSKKVNKRSRKSMIDFLSSHFRYFTMNSWNLSTSYAHNVKIRNLVEIPRALENTAYEMLGIAEVWDDINALVWEWDKSHNHAYQAGFNGRSGGYIVLYRGGLGVDDRVFSMPGLGMDQDENFEDWDMECLKARAELVQDFDGLCDTLLSRFLFYCKNYKVAEKKIMVSKTIKVLEEI